MEKMIRNWLVCLTILLLVTTIASGHSVVPNKVKVSEAVHTNKLPVSYWPSNSGFLNEPVIETLKPGFKFDRYGGFINDKGHFQDFGNFVAPKKVPYEMRSLPKGTNLKRPYSEYEVLKPMPNVKSGQAAPWFGEIGLGIQHELPLTIQDYIEQGYLRLISRQMP